MIRYDKNLTTSDSSQPHLGPCPGTATESMVSHSTTGLLHSTGLLLVQLGVVHPEAGVDHLVVLEEALLHKRAGDDEGPLGVAGPPWHAGHAQAQLQSVTRLNDVRLVRHAGERPNLAVEQRDLERRKQQRRCQRRHRAT